MRFLCAGDSHGNSRYILDCLNHAQTQQCELVVVLGDFGYMEHLNDGHLFLERLERYIDRFGIPIYFIDGNHDNHPLLWSRYPSDVTGFAPVRDGLFYIPRGHSWTWGGKKLVALGGAWSIDGKLRRADDDAMNKTGYSWWPTEMITWGEEEKASAVGKVDIMLTHDAPQGVPIPDIVHSPVGEVNRMHLRMALIATLPEILVHGHYHVRYSYNFDRSYHEGGELKWHRTRIEGLDRDGTARKLSQLIIDTSVMEENGTDQ